MLEIDRVTFTGAGVAAVVAESKYAAEDALGLIESNTSLDVVVDVEEAAAEGAPNCTRTRPATSSWTGPSATRRTDKALAEADVVVKERLVNQRLIPNPMEAKAQPRPTSRPPASTRSGCLLAGPAHHAAADDGLRVRDPRDEMRCIALHVGGSFGTKIFLYHEYVLMAALAEKVGRPVKWVETRREASSRPHGRDHVAHLEVGANRDGTITALKAKTYANLGGVLSTIAPGIPTTLYGRMLSGAYRTRTSTARCWASTPAPAWSTPTAAPGGPRRRTSSSGPSTWPGTRPRSGRRAPQELHPPDAFPL